MFRGLRDWRLVYGVKLESLLDSFSGVYDILKLAIVVGVTMAFLYVFLLLTHNRKERKSVKANAVAPREKDLILRRSLVRSTSIISHKIILESFEYAANRCNELRYTLKCIDIIVYCPQLMNMKSKYDGLTPFHRVCLQGHTCLVQFMLGKGADPFITTYAGEDALCMAVYHLLSNPTKSDFSCANVLTQKGCNLILTNRYDTFLRFAVNDRRADLVHWLILHADTKLPRVVRSRSVR